MEVPSTAGDAAERLSQSELCQALANSVEALPGELRTVFVMRVVEGLSTEETAECLGLTPANVKVRLRELLRTWIDEQIGSEARKLYQFDGKRCDRIVKHVME
jgi:RNA polymerase sigma-70 factor (ECF subfamily)